MIALKRTAYLSVAISTIVLTGCLSGGGGGGSDDADAGFVCETQGDTADGAREQQFRIDNCDFRITDEDLKAAEFSSLAGYESATQRSGVLNDALYRIEVPENWNGQLVMWAHGFRGGEGTSLTVDNPPNREQLLELGYAWAASSYRANYYDVKVGVEDTNRLALNFSDITGLAEPTKFLIAGYSMGGHVTGAAIEPENRQVLAEADLDVNYSAAMPMCGVMGDTTLFDYFGAYNLALFELGGDGADIFPADDVATKLATARSNLWIDYDANPNANGLQGSGFVLYQILQNLSGGERPVYPFGFGGYQETLQDLADSDGTIDGILTDQGVDTSYITYRFESDQLQPNLPETPYSAGQTQQELFVNASIYRAVPEPDANGPRGIGELRWIPKINGEFTIPVLTLHNLGDLFVPFSMQQIYRQRAINNGNPNLLVQRAIRSVVHCEFTTAEVEEAFTDLVAWEQNIAAIPAGDDVLDAAAVAEDDFGCAFTRGDRLVMQGLPTCASFQVPL
ncbi:hypothetical protein [Halopseudomonas pelagia]|uniref:hypothetical protein n=1 Tax=Halopseudomonas pelagia TaxID=553151 RepID=UPI0003A72F59|nr:hypothetical protein [Halopseudomonas pelagia]